MTDVNLLLKALEGNNMEGHFVPSREAMIPLMKRFMTDGSVIGCGDSVTLEECGVYQFLREGNYTFLDKYKPGLTKEEKREIYVKNFDADTFVTGINAITMKGELFNIDGNGSRVAPMIYGPRQVVCTKYSISLFCVCYT